METYTSPSTMDRTNLYVTWVLTVLCMVILYLVRETHWLEWLLYAFFFLLYVVVYGNLPTQFILAPEELILDAPFAKRRILLTDIVAIRPVEPADRGGLIRICGSSGLFGDWGYYYSPSLKKVKVYARRRNNWILIITAQHGKYIIAPDDPAFIHVLNKKLRR